MNRRQFRIIANKRLKTETLREAAERYFFGDAALIDIARQTNGHSSCIVRAAKRIDGEWQFILEVMSEGGEDD